MGRAVGDREAGRCQAISTLQKFLGDADPEIAEWSKLFISELQSGDPSFDGRDALYTPGRTFDETIYLLIHCEPVRASRRVEHALGQDLAGPAVPRADLRPGPRLPQRADPRAPAGDRQDDLGLHADGSPHCDNYLFRGFTDRTRRDRGNFFFESLVPRTFFKSGRADDPSEGVRKANIGFARYGTWHLEPKFQIREEAAIRYVRGRFQGWGCCEPGPHRGPLDRAGPHPGQRRAVHAARPGGRPDDQRLHPRHVQGKLNDWDGDGRIDMNSRDVLHRRR
ncbi:hypothetical protein V2I01_42690 [Micromonospora sp. BRA006-A]|nr:hypothetical protein [Micromonospora sp. BRA006-A]